MSIVERWFDDRPACIRCNERATPFGRSRCVECQAVIDAQRNVFGRALTPAELAIIAKKKGANA